MSDTPRTDSNEAAWSREYERSRECGWPSIVCVVDSDFARQLERELNNLTEQVNEKETALMECGYKLAGLTQERDQWREVAEKLARAGDRINRPYDRISYADAAAWDNAMAAYENLKGESK